MIEQVALEVGAWLDAPVIPLRGKKPVPALGGWKRFIGRGFQGIPDAAALPWSQADGYGIVIPPGVIVLDADTDDDGTLTTAKQTAASIGIYDDIKQCKHWVRTQSGGRHFYFDAEDIETEALPASLGPKLEIKRVGHYVVGPGSRGYEWGRGDADRFIEPLSHFPFLFAAA